MRIGGAKAGRTVLAVGDIAPHQPPGHGDARIVEVGFHQVDAQCLARWQPELVLSPVVGAGFDCVDLADALSAAGFSGRYRAVAVALPNPELIRCEIATGFPGLDFDLWDLDDLAAKSVGDDPAAE